MRTLLLVLLLAGCATEQGVTLYPRGPGPQGTGRIDRNTNEITVTIGDATYRGQNQFESLHDANNKASALLFGPAGQMRCEYVWIPPFLKEATGTCTDSRGTVYDVQIR